MPIFCKVLNYFFPNLDESIKFRLESINEKIKGNSTVLFANIIVLIFLHSLMLGISIILTAAFQFHLNNVWITQLTTFEAISLQHV